MIYNSKSGLKTINIRSYVIFIKLMGVYNIISKIDLLIVNLEATNINISSVPHLTPSIFKGTREENCSKILYMMTWRITFALIVEGGSYYI